MSRVGPQGPHTFHVRWLRERRRSPEIAAIPVGGCVSREFGGVTHVATCREGFWEYGVEKYPTLYAVVVAIAGAKEYARADGRERRSMSNWSASRFFRLKERAARPGGK